MEIQWHEKKESSLVLWAERILLILGMILFYSVYIDKVLPASEEWHIMYIKLMQQGKFPYRDFYYYLPPLDLFVTKFLWSLSFDSYLAYRIYRLAERILITGLVFEFLRRRVQSSYAWFGSMLGGLLYSACVYDLLGDYNQTGYLIIAVLMYAADFFFSTYGGKRLVASGLIGLCIGFLFLSKQTYFVAYCLVLFLLLIYYCLKEKDRKFILYCFFVIFGISVSILPCMIWLAENKAFIPFLEQVFLNTDSKGSLFDIIVKSVFYLYNDENMFCLFVVCIVGILIKLFANRKQLQNGILPHINRYVFPVITIFAIFYYFIILKNSYWTPIHSLVKDRYWTGIILALALTLFPACLWAIFEKKKTADLVGSSKYNCYQVIVSSCAILIIILLAYFGEKISFAFYIDESISTNYFAIIQRTVSLIIGIMIAEELWKGSVKDKQIDWKVFSVICIMFAANYAQKMACGKSLCAPYFYIVSFPIILALLMSMDAQYSLIKNSIIVAVCLITVLIGSCQKTQSSYRWWGWQEKPVGEHTEKIDIDGFHGFLVTGETKTVYEELTKVIKNNTDEQSHVYGYPHNVIFNLMSDRTCLDRFVPVPFYDVCASRYFSADVEHLKRNPPDIIVYQDIPYCYDVHKDAFQDGQELAQYEFEEWFAVNRNVLYELIGQASDFYVYKLKDNGIPVGYTYLECNRINTTASLKERFSIGELAKQCEQEAEKYFHGDGTIASPFLIRSAKDLVSLSKAVESGAMFREKYFLQTADIDMSQVATWMPIGQYDSGSYFSGTYNGGGHIIKNISCLQNLDNAHSALFGDLAGTVINLGILDSEFSGRLAGTVATNAYGSAAIVNCYAQNCRLEASEAAGGIAAYFSRGIIENCYTDCDMVINESAGKKNVLRYQNAGIKYYEQAYGISTDNAGIYNCYCTKYEVYNGLTSMLNSSHNYAVAKERESLELVASTMNSYIESSNNPNLKKWTYDEIQKCLRYQ